MIVRLVRQSERFLLLGMRKNIFSDGDFHDVEKQLLDTIEAAILGLEFLMVSLFRYI